MDRKTYMTIAQHYPSDQQSNFYFDLQKLVIVLSTDIPSIEEASRAFFSSAMLYFKALALDFEKIVQDIKRANEQLADAEDGPFESSDKEINLAFSKQQQTFMKTNKTIQSLYTLLEDNPVVK